MLATTGSQTTTSFDFDLLNLYCNSENVRLFFQMKPVAWKRPGIGKKYIKGKCITWLYDQQENEKKTLHDALKPYFEKTVFEKQIPVTAVLNYFFRRPVEHYKKNPQKDRSFNNVKEEYKFAYVTKIPDIDNLQKFLFDAMKGVLIKDDRQIDRVIVQKRWDIHGDCDGHVEIEFLNSQNVKVEVKEREPVECITIDDSEEEMEV